MVGMGLREVGRLLVVPPLLRVAGRGGGLLRRRSRLFPPAAALERPWQPAARALKGGRRRRGPLTAVKRHCVDEAAPSPPVGGPGGGLGRGGKGGRPGRLCPWRGPLPSRRAVPQRVPFQPKLRKTQGGKQEKKVIHPYSRKAAQLAREAHKQEKKEK